MNSHDEKRSAQRELSPSSKGEGLLQGLGEDHSCWKQQLHRHDAFEEVHTPVPIDSDGIGVYEP